MRPRDPISITRTDHTVAVFTVTAVREYHKQAFLTLAVYGNINHAGLRLITCGGPFKATTGNYLDNIVVYATHLLPPRLTPRADTAATSRPRPQGRWGASTARRAGCRARTCPYLLFLGGLGHRRHRSGAGQARLTLSRL